MCVDMIKVYKEGAFKDRISKTHFFFFEYSPFPKLLYMKNFIEVRSDHTDEIMQINISAISIIADKGDGSIIYIGEKKYIIKNSYKEVIDRIRITQGELKVDNF